MQNTLFTCTRLYGSCLDTPCELEVHFLLFSTFSIPYPLDPRRAIVEKLWTLEETLRWTRNGKGEAS